MDFPAQLTVDNSQPIRLLQVTDCHLGNKPGEELLGLNTDESLVDVLQCMQQQEPQPDLIVATGDIADGGGTEAYKRFLEVLSGYFTTPLAWLPGNHDLPATMAQVVQEHTGQPMASVVEMGSWQLILLDSSVPRHEHGDLSDQQLQLLRQALIDRPSHHALIFLHHQPVPVGSAWVDQYIVRSADAFFEVIDDFPQVKGICWGHVHQVFEADHKGVKLWATPSSCVQFKPQLDDFTVDRVMPGYRWFSLFDDGRIDSGVSRVEEKAYAIDYASVGY